MSQHQAGFKITELIIIIEDILYQYVLSQPIVLDDTSATGSIRVVLIIINIVIRISDIGADGVFQAELLIFQISVECAQITVCVNIGHFFVQYLKRIVTRQLVGSSQIIVTIRLVRTVERTLFHSTGHDSRTDIGTRHPVVFQIIATNVGADLQP